MIGQLNIDGKDKVEVALERLRTFEPPEGYYLAFSGGKDSVTVKALADMAGVKYDAHYRITTVDPPELVQFVKTFDDVQMDAAHYSDGTRVTMWNLIPKKKTPPTRLVRYCCKYLKESGGEGRFVITGVRKEESTKRSYRGGLELSEAKTKRIDSYDPDNPNQELIHICQKMARKYLNPIIDWTTEDVWEFIQKYGVKYCKLYDEGYTRLGCIGCPMASINARKKEFKRYPKYKQYYIKAFDKMLQNKKNKDGFEFESGEDVFDWWISEGKFSKRQLSILMRTE